MKAKSKQDMAEEYGVSRKTFDKWLKKHNIKISRGLLTPKDQEMIYKKDRGSQKGLKFPKIP